jgi:hypothetical protein
MERVWTKWYEFPRKYTGNYFVRTRDIMTGATREMVTAKLLPEVTDWIQERGCWASVDTASYRHGIKIRFDDEGLLVECILMWGLTALA